MKRTCFALACLLIVTVLVGTAPAQESKTFAGYVPEGAIFYVSRHNLESVWRIIEQSNFWRTFTGLKIWDGVDFDWYEEFRDEFAENLGFEFSTENVMAVLGKDCAVAVYLEPAADDQAGPTIEVLFVSQMNPPERVEEIVDKLLERAKSEGDDDVIISSLEHAGAKVRTIKTKDDDPPIQLRLAMKDGVLFAGIGNTVPRIEACLDCMAGEGAPLAQAEEFTRLIGMARQDRGEFFGDMYWSVAAFQQFLTRLAEEQPDLAMLAQLFEMTAGTTKAMAITAHIDRGLRIMAAIEPSAEMAELMDMMRTVAPSAGTHAKYVRPDALIYYGANSMPPLAEMWPYMMKAWSKAGFDQIIRDGIEQMELALEIDFEADLLDNIGTEFAFVLEGVDMETAPFPLPKLTVLLQVKDTGKAQAFIDKLVGLLGETMAPDMELTVTELEHEGATLKVVEIPVPFLQITLTPTIGITENFLFISSSREHAKATLSAAKGGVGLVNSPVYRGLGIPEKTNAVMLVNMEELLKVGRQVADWAVTMAEMQGAGEEAKQQVDGYVRPLLDCLGVLKAVAAYGSTTAESPVAVYVIRTEDIPAN